MLPCGMNVRLSLRLQPVCVELSRVLRSSDFPILSACDISDLFFYQSDDENRVVLFFFGFFLVFIACRFWDWLCRACGPEEGSVHIIGLWFDKLQKEELGTYRGVYCLVFCQC